MVFRDSFSRFVFTCHRNARRKAVKEKEKMKNKKKKTENKREILTSPGRDRCFWASLYTLLLRFHHLLHLVHLRLSFSFI